MKRTIPPLGDEDILVLLGGPCPGGRHTGGFGCFSYDSTAYLGVSIPGSQDGLYGVTIVYTSDLWPLATGWLTVEGAGRSQAPRLPVCHESKW